MEIKQLYLFSGLGADERVFQRLDFSGYTVTFIQWLVPATDETLENYARRLCTQITTPFPVLIGLSFGGIVAVEVAKQIETQQVILLASAKNKREIPFYYRWAGSLRLHRLLPVALLKRSNGVSNWLFGAHSTLEKQLLKSVLADTDPLFLKWAIDKIARWKNTAELRNIRHIHGTSDRLLPIRFVKSDARIEKGGHFMTLGNSEEVTACIRQALSGWTK